MITITESAKNKITELILENQEEFLRVSVKGGGCSGFSYAFDFGDKSEDDFEFGTVLVDAMSMQYLQGADIDYVEELMGASFKVTNPNAVATCGCGSSFSAT
jgi:iron-sulfur cluster assembly accessory protein